MQDLLEFQKGFTMVCFETRRMEKGGISKEQLAETLNNVLANVMNIVVTPDYERRAVENAFIRELLFDVGALYDKPLKEIISILLQEMINQYLDDSIGDSLYCQAANAYFDVLYGRRVYHPEGPLAETAPLFEINPEPQSPPKTTRVPPNSPQPAQVRQKPQQSTTNVRPTSKKAPRTTPPMPPQIHAKTLPLGLTTYAVQKGDQTVFVHDERVQKHLKKSTVVIEEIQDKPQPRAKTAGKKGLAIDEILDPKSTINQDSGAPEKDILESTFEGITREALSLDTSR